MSRATHYVRNNAEQLAARPQGHRVGDPVLARRVVVVRKTSHVELLASRPDLKLQTAMASGDPLADRVQLAHREHVHSCEVVVAALQHRRVSFRVVRNLTRRLAAWADLVITVGGDGTFLRASHAVEPGELGDGPPMLAVNSATSTSVGYFSAATVQDFAETLDVIGTGRVRSQGLWRMRVAVNGVALPQLVLNDVLVAHQSPAETSRYSIIVDGQRQDQKSSGIWIATAPGSTAAIRATGGQVLPISDRALQYRTRELMHWAVVGEPLLGGLIADQCEVISRMSEGMVYMDGGHERLALGFGDRVTFSCAERPLPWVAPATLRT